MFCTFEENSKNIDKNKNIRVTCKTKQRQSTLQLYCLITQPFNVIVTHFIEKWKEKELLFLSCLANVVMKLITFLTILCIVFRGFPHLRKEFHFSILSLLIVVLYFLYYTKKNLPSYKSTQFAHLRGVAYF